MSESESGTSASPHQTSTAVWIRRISFTVIILGILVLIRILPTAPALQVLTTQVEQLGALAPFVFVVLYFFVTVFMLPAWPLSMAAGALFGLIAGTAVVASGATLGMAATFVIGRYAARGAVERKFAHYPRFAAMDRAVSQGGWRIVALLRLSPVVPFNLQNYLYGLTAIRFWPCILASAVAILPGTVMYVYLGFAGRAGITAIGEGETGRGPGQWALLIVGLAATIVASVYIAKLARKAIKEQSGVEEDARANQVLNDGSWVVRHPLLSTSMAVIGAALVLLAAGVAKANSGTLVNMFGPGAVVMEEAYVEKPDGPRVDHSALDEILKGHVNSSGGVDYAGLKADPEPLRGYIASLEKAPFDELGRNEKLALLINAYNAFTLELIIENLDEGIHSIRDIPSRKRWDDVRWNVGGKIYSLNQIEHDQIRPRFREPNIHFALVCAAVGCPPLRKEAYSGSRIDEQLNDQAQTVHTNGSRWFQFDADSRVLRLTSLYQWYAKDFKQVSGSVVSHAAKYSAELADFIGEGGQPKVKWLDYDWSLNSQENLE